MTPYGLARKISTRLRDAGCDLRTEVRRDNQVAGDAQVIVYAPYTKEERIRGGPKVYPVAAIDIDLDLSFEVRGTEASEVEAVLECLR